MMQTYLKVIIKYKRNQWTNFIEEKLQNFMQNKTC